MGNGSDVWEMPVENVPSTLCGDRRARAGGPDKIRTCGLCLRRAAAWPDRCLREIGNREERTGIRFEKERVYGYSGGAKALPGRPLDVSSQTLMAHSHRVIRRMRYGTSSSRERHDDRAAVFRVKRLEGATACDP